MSVISYYIATVFLAVLLQVTIASRRRLLVGIVLFFMVGGLIAVSYDLTVDGGSGFNLWLWFLIAMPIGCVAGLVISAGMYWLLRNYQALAITLFVVIGFSFAPYPVSKIILFGCGELNRREALPIVDATVRYRQEHAGDFPSDYHQLINEGYLDHEPIVYCFDTPRYTFIHFRNGVVFLTTPSSSAGGTPRYNFSTKAWESGCNNYDSYTGVCD